MGGGSGWTYLLGDVLRIYSGDLKVGEIGGRQMTQGMWLGIAISDGDLNCYGISVPDTKPTRESVGKHYRSRLLFHFQSHWIATYIVPLMTDF